jgi:hypothetical protein
MSRTREQPAYALRIYEYLKEARNSDFACGGALSNFRSAASVVEVRAEQNRPAPPGHTAQSDSSRQVVHSYIQKLLREVGTEKAGAFLLQLYPTRTLNSDCHQQ